MGCILIGSCLALPCLALPCLALPCLALQEKKINTFKIIKQNTPLLFYKNFDGKSYYLQGEKFNINIYR
ncbi:hypothetical protein ACK840_000475 [Salmonella enterica]